MLGELKMSELGGEKRNLLPNTGVLGVLSTFELTLLLLLFLLTIAAPNGEKGEKEARLENGVEGALLEVEERVPGGFEEREEGR